MEQQGFVSWLSDYGMISEMLKTYSYQQILEAAAVFLKVKPEALERYPMDIYSKGRHNGDYRCVLEDLIKNIEHYDWVFSHLDDEKSRIVFYDLVVYRIVPMPCFLKAACDAGTRQKSYPWTEISKKESVLSRWISRGQRYQLCWEQRDGSGKIFRSLLSVHIT